jgi:hypothetical protein
LRIVLSLGHAYHRHRLHGDRRITTTDSLPLLSSSPPAATVPTSPLQLYLLSCVASCKMCRARTCVHTYPHIKWDSKGVRTPPLHGITVIISEVKEGQRTPLCPHQRPAPPPRDLERAAARSLRLPLARHRDFTLDASASTNRNIAREDVIQKHHQTAARCRRLLAGKPRHPWFVTNTGFSAAPEAPWSPTRSARWISSKSKGGRTRT